MTKTYASFAALSLFMTACSAAALPNAVPPVTAIAPAAAIASPAPAAQPARAATAEAPVAAPAHSRPPAHHVSEPAAAPREAMRDVLSCDVRAQPTANGVLIQAVARANRAFEGEYELVITKSGGDGSSDVTQSGPFSAAAGETVTLGSTELGADGRYRAALVLRDGSGELCRRERRS